MHYSLHTHLLFSQHVTQGAIHSTKISGNFGPKLNGSVRSNQKSFEKTGPPFEVDLFSRLDRSDRKMTVPFDHSDSFSSPVLTVRYMMPTTRKRAAPPASVYRCSFCHNFSDSLENLLSHECNAITGKFLVNLFVAFAKNKTYKNKVEVCIRVSTSCDHSRQNHFEKL